MSMVTTQFGPAAAVGRQEAFPPPAGLPRVGGGEPPAEVKTVEAASKAAPPAREKGKGSDIKDLVSEANLSLNGMTALQINVDRDLGKMVVQVVDRNTNQVIRQIPDEHMVDLVKRMKELQGLLFDTKA